MRQQRKVLDSAPQILVGYYRRYMKLYSENLSYQYFELANIINDIAMDVLLGDSFLEYREGIKKVREELNLSNINSG